MTDSRENAIDVLEKWTFHFDSSPSNRQVSKWVENEC